MSDKLTVHEIAAMWLCGEKYAEIGLSAKDYWKELSEWDKANVKRMVKEIAEALERDA